MDVSRYSIVTSDSREVRPGCLFVAIPGGTSDGHDFIEEVVEKGAAAIIGERPLEGKLKVPYTRVNDSRLALAQAAAAFYGHPSHAMKVAGVTGTSGKTTTTYLLESILHAAGHKVGVIGTVNFRFGTANETRILPSTHTTPGPVELQGLISEMRAQEVTHLVMEVSSHALRQRRAHGIEFDAVAFTNLSPEHLDFHPGMEDYFASKKILFTELFAASRAAGKSPRRAVNLDDPYGARLFNELGGSDLLGFSLSGLTEGAVDGAGLQDSLEGISGEVRLRGTGKDRVLRLRSGLLGRFNAANILTAIALAEGLGIPENSMTEGIRRLQGVPGRLERVPDPRGIHVFVDYAHKPDALEKVLKNLQTFRKPHRLITVFGCGGDRDRGKRPVMGRIAQQLSDLVIVTSDNPRTEDPGAIIAEIVSGMTEKPDYLVEPDRKRAILEAIRRAVPGDLVLIAGKGHEDYQIMGTRKLPFDDRAIAAEALRRVT